MKKKIIVMITIVMVVIGIITAIHFIANKDSSVNQDTNQDTNKGASQETYQPNDENQFKAKVTEITDEYIMVEALDEQTIVGEVRLNTGLIKDDIIQQLQEGDIVLVTHDGTSTMSIPPQMTALELCILSS